MQVIPTSELHPKKIEDLNKQPTLKTRMYVSEDGEWFVHETTTLDIKPISYMKKVFRNEAGS